MRCLEHYKPSYINHGEILKYMMDWYEEEEIMRDNLMLMGDEDEITIVYTNGRKWKQKNVDEWVVRKNKSGGFDIDYTYFHHYKSTGNHFIKECDNVINFRSTKGDVSKVITYTVINGVKTTTEHYFQPIKESV